MLVASSAGLVACGGESAEPGTDGGGGGEILCAISLGIVDAADAVDKSELNVCSGAFPNCLLVLQQDGLAYYRCCGTELFLDGGHAPNCR